MTARLAGGTLRIFSGDIPESPGADTGSAQLLAELGFQSPAFPPAQAGSAVPFPLTNGVVIASGKPTWLQAVTADGRVVFDELVNQGDGSLEIEPAWAEVGSVLVIDRLVYSN